MKKDFDVWYADHAKNLDLSSDPNDSKHHYNYQAAYDAGAEPDTKGHWPSTYKTDTHPNLVIDGINTKTNKLDLKGMSFRLKQDVELSQKAGYDSDDIKTYVKKKIDSGEEKQWKVGEDVVILKAAGYPEDEIQKHVLKSLMSMSMEERLASAKNKAEEIIMQASSLLPLTTPEDPLVTIDAHGLSRMLTPEENLINAVQTGQDIEEIKREYVLFTAEREKENVQEAFDQIERQKQTKELEGKFIAKTINRLVRTSGDLSSVGHHVLSLIAKPFSKETSDYFDELSRGMHAYAGAPKHATPQENKFDWVADLTTGSSPMLGYSMIWYAGGPVTGMIGSALTVAAFEGNIAYQAARDRGVEPKEAHRIELAVASLNTAIEFMFGGAGKYIPKTRVTSKFLTKLYRGKNFTTKAIKTGLGEGLEEVLQEFSHMFVGGDVPRKTDGSIDADVVVDRAIESALGGALLGFGFSTSVGTIVRNKSLDKVIDNLTKMYPQFDKDAIRRGAEVQLDGGNLIEAYDEMNLTPLGQHSNESTVLKAVDQKHPIKKQMMKSAISKFLSQQTDLNLEETSETTEGVDEDSVTESQDTPTSVPKEKTVQDMTRTATLETYAQNSFGKPFAELSSEVQTSINEDYNEYLESASTSRIEIGRVSSNEGAFAEAEVEVNKWEDAHDGKSPSLKEQIKIHQKHGVIPAGEAELYESVMEALPEHYFEQIRLYFLKQNKSGAHAKYIPISSRAYMTGLADIIELFDAREPTVFVHELAHKIMERILNRTDLASLFSIYRQSPAFEAYVQALVTKKQLTQTVETQEKILLVQNTQHSIMYENSLEEWFAEAFRNYVIGKQKIKISDALLRIFENLKETLRNIYSVASQWTQLNPDMKKFFDTLLLRPEESYDPESTDALNKMLKVVGAPENKFYSKPDQALNNLSCNDLIDLAMTGDAIAQKELRRRTNEPKKPVVEEKKKRLRLLGEAHKMQRDMNFDHDDAKKFKKGITGKDSMTDMDSNQIINLIHAMKDFQKFLHNPDQLIELIKPELALSENEYQSLVTASNNDSVIIASVLQNMAREGIYQGPQFRKQQVLYWKEIARNMSKWEKKTEGLSDYDVSQLNRLQSFENMRYTMMQLEMSSGIPIYRHWRTVVEKTTKAEVKVYQDMVKRLENIGIGKTSTKYYALQDLVVNKVLFEADDTKRKELYNNLSVEQRQLYSTMHDILSGPSADFVRGIRWYLWNQAMSKAEATTKNKKSLFSEAAKLRPKDISAKNADKILLEGRQTWENGNFLEWIKTQKFGTREQYFMTDSEVKTFANHFIFAPELKPGAAIGPSINVGKPGYTKTREGKSQFLQRPVIQAVMYHYRSAAVIFSAMDSLGKFTNAFEETLPSDEDRNAMTRYVSNIMGLPESASKPIQYLESTQRFFWRQFPLQASRALHFTVRNLLQTVLTTGQIGTAEMTRSAFKLLGKGMSDFTTKIRQQDWTNVTQKRQYQQEYMLLRETSIAVGGGQQGKSKISRAIQGSKATRGYMVATDFIGQILPLSDEINRRLTWPVFAESAEHQFDNFQKHQSLTRVRNSLKLDTLEAVQKHELLGYLAKGDKLNFIKYYARFKTMNVHYGYSRMHRSLTEQYRSGRVFMNLFNWTRGYFNVLHRNAFKPLVKADSDASARWQAATSLVSIWAGMRIAQELARAFMGRRKRDDYDMIQSLLGWDPLGVADIGIEFYETTTSLIADLIESTDSIPEKAAKVSKTISNDLIEPFMPLADVYIAHFEATNDLGNARLWEAIREDLNFRYQKHYGRKFSYEDRDTRQKIQRVLFGSEREIKDTKSWDELTVWEQTIHIGLGKQSSW